MASVEESWKEATEGLDEGVCDSWLARLQESYAEERRTFHNLDSLADKLLHYVEVRERLKNPKAVLLALFFQKWVVVVVIVVVAYNCNNDKINYAQLWVRPEGARRREQEPGSLQRVRRGGWYTRRKFKNDLQQLFILDKVELVEKPLIIIIVKIAPLIFTNEIYRKRISNDYLSRWVT